MNKVTHHLVCLKTSISFFAEYLLSFKPYIDFDFIILPNVQAIDNYNYINSRYHVYYFCSGMSNFILKKDIRKVLINTEQLTRPEYKDSCVNYLKSKCPIYDYSPENNSIMKNKLTYFPYQYYDEEVNKLKDLINNEEKKYDIAFCGLPSVRRTDIINKLIEKGITVNGISSLWGVQRDKAIASCKILLNIHCNETYNVYETIRCDRWVFAGLPIISEDSIASDKLDVNNVIIFTKYDKLVDTVIEALKNYDTFYETYKKDYDEKINKIKSIRHSYLQRVID